MFLISLVEEENPADSRSRGKYMTKMVVGTKNVFEPLYINDNIAINPEF